MRFEDFPERFRLKIVIDPETDCWNWTGAINRVGGYGRIRNEDGEMELVHRFTFRRVRGVRAGKWRVRHGCHNRLCCNPAHLKAGTQKHNMKDMREAGRGYWQTNPEQARERGLWLHARQQEKRNGKAQTEDAGDGEADGLAEDRRVA